MTVRRETPSRSAISGIPTRSSCSLISLSGVGRDFGGRQVHLVVAGVDVVDRVQESEDIVVVGGDDRGRQTLVVSVECLLPVLVGAGKWEGTEILELVDGGQRLGGGASNGTEVAIVGGLADGREVVGHRGQKRRGVAPPGEGVGNPRVGRDVR